MKTLRQTCAATILCLTLSASIFAGQISSPGALPPPPPPPNEETTSSSLMTIILTIISLVPVP